MKVLPHKLLRGLNIFVRWSQPRVLINALSQHNLKRRERRITSQKSDLPVSSSSPRVSPKKADIMKLSSVLLSLLLAPATLVQAHGGDGGKNGRKTNECLRFSTLLSVTDQSDIPIGIMISVQFCLIPLDSLDCTRLTSLITLP
jgi:hypothetical protein